MGFRGRRRNPACWRNIPKIRPTPISIENPNIRTVQSTPPTSTATGYRYIGRCRCGYGPNAYYQAPDGSVVPAYQIFGGAASPQRVPSTAPNSSIDQEKTLKQRLETLQEEIAEVTNQLEELEGKKKRFPFKWLKK
ncbi:MAG: hypothetical protein KIH08_11250 [Candidatus Freyarchaeota archaeon]|nr:hypothetical protein [Candidatus Jordarchaeia archaeon]MBS7268780.1 hypothetical protein [Candidatus Jordarchaeia archaeon]